MPRSSSSPLTSRRLRPLVAAIGLACLPAHSAFAQDATLAEVQVLGTAEEQLRQAPGVSVITEEDIAERPPANDLSELIRTMPGVNLTGNSSSGAYGNNRQIDLRGMGPENTMILIDGKPVSSRNSVRMGRNGERNTRGDSNWVPASAVERIEVLRGPAAARYGSGAAGGVINIITKRPSDTLSGSVTAYTLVPQDKDFSSTQRLGFNLAGPLAEKFSFRLYGNVAKTDADEPDINASVVDPNATPPAGREGVRNRDINGLLRWDLTEGHVLEFEAGFSRQGNIYAGDRLFDSSNAAMQELANSGAETNTMYRRTGSVTHRGDYGEGRTSRVTLAYEGTTNRRLNEGLAGGAEGSISATAQPSENQLDQYFLNGEFNTPLEIGGIRQMLTAGFEYRKEKLEDPYATARGQTINNNPTSISKSDTRAVFVENNIALGNWVVTPGLRLDDHDKFGLNWSPSLNASWEVTPEITVKGGIARVFKAPNLYQSNPNYLYVTGGNGCPYLPDGTRVQGPCYIFGNEDLDPEISINKELGVAWNRAGWGAGLTYFHNDYKNKIIADMGDQDIPDFIDIGGSLARPFQWVNTGKAIIRGFEGNLDIPLSSDLGRSLMLRNNFTYMIESKNKNTGQPLSVIPRYTINSMLDWQATEKLSVLATATFYGKQEPRDRNPANNTTVTGDGLKVRGAYALYGLSAGYQFNKTFNLRAGVNNLFDKRLYRASSGSGQGANTYNEPGRTYYATLTASF
ncbi:FepA family TonB-dependent siderophore receptor [Thauera sp. SDU_THAU2]|uniref:FepA family TonB-dependent siderophore receptor n=1 Tax=Thauera sp. SDU_THAU2 TaxID=3136633 RepID=UPI00311E42B3